jgi:hypothetical protein
MSDGNQLGIISGQGCASRRFADALLRSCGIAQVSLRIADPTRGDTGSQLGLEPPPSEDIQISPAVVTSLPPSPGGTRRMQVAMSATAVEALANKYQVTDVPTWLLTAQGVVQHDQLWHIDSVTVDHFGTDCLYHLTATE